MGGYAPRALEHSVRPRRSGCASGRPLNFTVRQPHVSAAIAIWQSYGPHLASAPDLRRWQRKVICPVQ